MDKADIGLVGLGVMGRNLAWNMADHGFTVGVWNREADMQAAVLAERSAGLVPAATLADMVKSLSRPRRVLLMITAGRPVDLVLDALEPLLEPGDIVVDGGNSWFEDTRRREQRLAARGLSFVGMGVSGGEEGARRGPSLMPGGAAEAYARLRPVLEAIAATTDAGPCVTHVGPDGAGHFVKMVHNGIEYADMQLIAESYDVLRRLGGKDAPALADVFARWNEGPLESFLVDITARIFRVPDARAGGWLVDRVRDQAGQKGTGKWTVQVALDLGVAIPTIAAALDARVISSMKPAREIAARSLAGPAGGALPPVPDDLIDQVHDALLAAKVLAYAQGMALVAAASTTHGWGVDPGELGRIWKGGCIIRARLLDVMRRAYARDRALPSLVLDPEVRAIVERCQPRWRAVVGLAQAHGIPVPAMAASLAWYDGYRTASLPQNLTQAQRDAFGAHTYQRADAPDEGFVHTDWLAGGGAM
ncbi:MAG: NADP-dependent phosphogluconate dehydrogenase [Deltaproteobacteria bacterium]|nr:NADP-dependent phosphogluconate dehydrogenase [Deltaproteobacteria bacterium]